MYLCTVYIAQANKALSRIMVTGLSWVEKKYSPECGISCAVMYYTDFFLVLLSSIYYLHILCSLHEKFLFRFTQECSIHIESRAVHI